VHQIRLLLGAWASLTKDLLLTFNGGQREKLAPPVIESLAPFASVNTIKITFAEDAAKRAQLRLQVAPAILQAAMRGERSYYGRTFEASTHISGVLQDVNRDFRDSRQLNFCFNDKSRDRGLQFDRAHGSTEPLMPDLYFLRELKMWRQADRSHDMYQGPPFLERNKQLFWRGSTTDQFIHSIEDFYNNRRVKACLLTQRELPGHANCKIVRSVQLPEQIRREARHFLKRNDILSDVVDTREFAQYQMGPDLPGNASAWGTCVRYFQGMLIFRVGHEHELLY